MYALIKALELLPDADAMNETEFTTGMHFIVCMTKRSLAKLPRTFPKYLFPTLDLTPFATGTSAISSMPSPEKDEMLAFRGVDASVSSDGNRTLHEQLKTLQDAASLLQLLENEVCVWCSNSGDRTHLQLTTNGLCGALDAQQTRTSECANATRAVGTPHGRESPSLSPSPR